MRNSACHVIKGLYKYVGNTINIRTIYEGKEKRNITEAFPWIKKIDVWSCSEDR